MTIKQKAIDAINSLPDKIELDDIMYRLYVLDKIQQGQEAINKNEKTTIEELKKEIETWQYGQIPPKKR